LIQAAEFRVALDQHFDVLLLIFEHQSTSSTKARTNPARANAHRRSGAWENERQVRQSAIRFTGAGEVQTLMIAKAALMGSSSAMPGKRKIAVT
ncbi:MAG: hypothetical protein ACREUK_10185, partial [Burkholderiales bacterium]